MSKEAKLYGRVLVRFEINAVTGLHIGSGQGKMEIGGQDNPVMRDPISNRPYIPGSSLRGKMRSQLEKKTNAVQNKRVGQAIIHTCEKAKDFESCAVCHLFGVPGDEDFSRPTQLIVRDISMSEESAAVLDKAHTVLPYTEIKYEVAIDRVTSKAAPRNIERVPAGAVFAPGEMVFNVYSKEDCERFKYVIECLQLVEDDYLGGSGSRGSGKVAFKSIQLSARNNADYTNEQKFEKLDDLAELVARQGEVLAWMAKIILAE